MTPPPSPATVGTALQQARLAGLDRLDAERLLLHCLGRAAQERAWLIAHDRDTLGAEVALAFDRLCQRRLGGEPLAYLLGQREFHGLVLQVDARVLDPRPDTETLVDWALDVLAGQRRPSVLDLGTGSGAIALALQQRRPDALVWALDASAAALTVATRNAQRLKLPVQFCLGHWLRGWPQEPESAQAPTVARPRCFDLIVSNPPYIRADDPHLLALQHEPRQALASGADGLDDIREIVAQAHAHLNPGGRLLLEHGWDQGAQVAALLAQAGYQRIAQRHDLAGHWRCSGGEVAGSQ